MVRYSLVILFLNGPLAFILLGICYWLGLITPYYSPEYTPATRAVSEAFGVLIALPSLIALSAVVYTLARSAFWITAWTLAMGYAVFALVRGMVTIARRR